MPTSNGLRKPLGSRVSAVVGKCGWPGCLRAPERRPGWLRVDRVLGEMGTGKDSPAGRQESQADKGRAGSG